MRIITISMIIGPFMLLGALPAPADAPSSLLETGTFIQLAAASDDQAADRDGVIQNARKITAEWQQKLRAWNERTEATEKAAGTAAEADLDKAWKSIEAASDRLQTASTEDWESAKTAFERASSNLTATWRKAHPEEK